MSKYQVMHTSLRRTVPPATEPVTRAQAKANSKIDITAEDDEIDAMIKEAREELEMATSSAYITQTWVLCLDHFPRPRGSDTYRPNGRQIDLKICPVIAVSSIVYLDASGDQQTLSPDVYLVDVASRPAQITLKAGQTWPSTLVQANAVTITFTAGYGDPADVPALVKRAIKLRVDHWFKYRGIATDPKYKAGEDAWNALKQTLSWGTYP